MRFDVVARRKARHVGAADRDGVDVVPAGVGVAAEDSAAPMEEIIATIDAKVAELVARGATVDHSGRIDTDTLQRYSVVMHDPEEGDEFCVA